ncbi:hypothetical protein MWH25_02305 [Natroniella acetigena]|uniref:hypothetical protein n=1 Tax=Natroniella acetigena TaxID=52004 RepID=UPI00200B195D|nr:hypothetical protein [Natroniella acetigena]MCK8826582.1 hypothetical protein [Natroniella acetigena]
MNTIRQIEELSFKEVINLSPKAKIEEIFEYFDFKDIINDVKSQFNNKSKRI